MAAIVRIKMLPKTYRNCILQGHRFSGKDALEEQLVDVVVEGEEEVFNKAKELGLKWSGKAKAGAIYGSLKREMYVEAVNNLELKGWRPESKL